MGPKNWEPQITLEDNVTCDALNNADRVGQVGKYADYSDRDMSYD